MSAAVAGTIIGALTAIGVVLGAITQLRKSKPEADQVLVTTAISSAQDVVVIQRDTINDLHARLSLLEEQMREVTESERRLREERDRLARELAESERRLREEREELLRENTTLRERVTHLEEQVVELTARIRDK